MINPKSITNYNRSKASLEHVILFWVCAAGKNGVTAAKCLDNLLKTWRPKASLVKKNPTPFQIIRYISHTGDLAQELKNHGIGCYNHKARTFLCLAWSYLDLKTCTVEQLEEIPGIGPKTARCFLIHSRENQPYAGLDTHVLKFLRDKGHNAPKSTPTGKKYRELEKIFLDYVKESGKTVADFDLFIWLKYRAA